MRRGKWLRVAAILVIPILAGGRSADAPAGLAEPALADKVVIYNISDLTQGDQKRADVIAKGIRDYDAAAWTGFHKLADLRVSPNQIVINGSTDVRNYARQSIDRARSEHYVRVEIQYRVIVGDAQLKRLEQEVGRQALSGAKGDVAGLDVGQEIIGTSEVVMSSGEHCVLLDGTTLSLPKVTTTINIYGDRLDVGGDLIDSSATGTAKPMPWCVGNGGSCVVPIGATEENHWLAIHARVLRLEPANAVHWTESD